MLKENDRYDLEIITWEGKYYNSFYGFTEMASHFKMASGCDNVVSIDIISGVTGEILLSYTTEKGVTYVDKDFAIRAINDELN